MEEGIPDSNRKCMKQQDRGLVQFDQNEGGEGREGGGRDCERSGPERLAGVLRIGSELDGGIQGTMVQF